MRFFKVGILGCNRVAQHYKFLLKEYKKMDSIKITACCDLNKRYASDLAGEFDAKSYSSLEEMLDKEKMDFVLVLTPSGLHYKHSLQCLSKNVSVVVEKPICLIPEQAYELDAFAKSNNLFITSVFQNRYNPAVKKLKEQVENNGFGKLVSASLRLRWCRYQDYYEDGWHGTWKMDGGVICQQAIHHIDALRWILGPVESVCAHMSNQLNNLEAEDTVVGLIKFESGISATVELTTAARPKDYEASIAIVGEKGFAQIGGIALNLIDNWEFQESSETFNEVASKYNVNVSNGMGYGHLYFLEDLLSSLRNNDQNIPMQVPESTNALELVHSFYASFEEGRWVKMNEKKRSKLLGL